MSQSEVFRFKVRLNRIVISILSVVFIWFTYDTIMRHENIGTIMIAGTLAFILLVITIVSIFGSSDIIINDESISRRLFGKTWQTIRWDNVGYIQRFPLSNGYGGTFDVYSIHPKTKPESVFRPTGRLHFNKTGLNDSDKLIGLLNRYIQEHGIRVEVREKIGGKKELVTHL